MAAGDLLDIRRERGHVHMPGEIGDIGKGHKRRDWVGSVNDRDFGRGSRRRTATDKSGERERERGDGCCWLVWPTLLCEENEKPWVVVVREMASEAHPNFFNIYFSVLQLDDMSFYGTILKFHRNCMRIERKRIQIFHIILCYKVTIIVNFQNLQP